LVRKSDKNCKKNELGSMREREREREREGKEERKHNRSYKYS
jgi:hypothetical protein